MESHIHKNEETSRRGAELNLALQQTEELKCKPCDGSMMLIKMAYGSNSRMHAKYHIEILKIITSGTSLFFFSSLILVVKAVCVF